MYIIKKWLPRRWGVWTKNKKIVRSILVYYSILEALLSLWYRALCTKEWRVGVWDVKVVFHIYIIIFFPVFLLRRDYSPRPRDSWWKIFRVVVFYLFHVRQRARRTVIKRFENMFRQVIIRTGADSGRSKTSSINSASAKNHRCVDRRMVGKWKTCALQQHENGGVLLLSLLLLFHCLYIMYVLICYAAQRKCLNKDDIIRYEVV